MKKEKLIRKEEKKTRALVKEAFNAENVKGKTNPLVETLVKSVSVNRAMLKREKNAKKVWEDTYHQQLFFKFKELVDRHNEIFEIKINKLEDKISDRKLVLKVLEEKISKAKLELSEVKKHG